MRTLLPLLSFLTLSCGNSITGLVTDSPSVPLATLLDAPETVRTDSRVLVGDAYLWRDFMPGQMDTSLRGVIELSVQEASPLPDGIWIDRLWVIDDAVVWETESFREPHPDGEDRLEVVAEGGPKWETGISVDVVFRIRGLPEGPHLLRVPGVEIVETH